MRIFILTLSIATATTFAAATLNAQQEAAADSRVAEKPDADQQAAANTAAKSVEQDEKQPVVGEIPNPIRNPGFEESEPGNREFGWHMGDVSQLQPKLGKRSGLLSSDAKPFRRGMIQAVDAKPYRGQRIRYRAAVRVESVAESGDERGCQARLWFRVDRKQADGSRPPVGAFDNMHDRPIRSSQWQYYDLVGDVHDDATSIAFGMFFQGNGNVWIDDASIQVVDENVAVTARNLNSADPDSDKVRNGGFEQGRVGERIEGWSAPELDGYHAMISDKEPKLGAHCGLLQRDPGDHKERQFGALNSGLDATPYRGKRVRFRAAVRTMVDGEGNQAQLWFRVDRPQKDGAPVIGAFDNMHDRPITATQWQYYDIVGDVAPDARGIIIGLLLIGDGKAFIDDVSFEIVANDVEPTARVLGAAGGSAINEIGPGLFEILGSTEVVSTNRWLSKDESDEAVLLLPLPLSYRDQVPLSYQLSADPPEALKSAVVYQDQPKNFVAKVVLSELSKHKKVDLKFRSSVLVGPSSFDDVPATARIPDTWPDEAKEWLASTWCVEAEHDRIQSIAEEIRDQTDDVLQVIGHVEEKAQSIFRASKGHVRNLTAVEALDKRGSCTSCGNLVAALLRACDVPARVLAGYPSWSGPLQTHYIVEAYVPVSGWYPIESTMCRSPWPNSQQVNVAIIPPEYEAKDVAGRRRNVAGGVPYLSLTEGEGSGSFYTRGTIEGGRSCDHQCKLIRRFDSDAAQWSVVMQWAKPRWESWVESSPHGKSGILSFGATADTITAQSPQELVAELDR